MSPQSKFPAFLLRDREKEIAVMQARISYLEGVLDEYEGNEHEGQDTPPVKEDKRANHPLRQALLRLRLVEWKLQSGEYGMLTANLNWDMSQAVAAIVDAVREPK